MQTRSRPSRRNLVVAVLGLALLVAMVLSTQFVTPEELAAAGPQKFDPKATAQELFDQAQSDLPDQAAPLADVVTALQQDTQQAATEFKAANPSEGAYVFVVSADGTVTDATADSLRLKVDGVPNQTQVLVPLTTAMNGTVVRDALGFRFADAPGQSAFQFVGDELKKLMQQQVRSAVPDPQTLKGKPVSVVGAISVLDTGAPQPAAKPVSVQPVVIQEGA